MSVSNFLQSKRWFQGPRFLWNTPINWPAQPEICKRLELSDPEVKKRALCLANVCEPPHFLDNLVSRFSSWQKLLKVCAWILRAMKAFKKTAESSNVENDSSVSARWRLSVEDLREAERVIVGFFQQKQFQSEIESLKANKSISRSSNLLNLDPFLKEGLLCVGGRLRLSKLSPLSKHPIILPHKCTISFLIIREIHEKTGHSGRQFFLSALREKFWLINGSSVVRNVLSNCVLCKRNFGRPTNQKMADLPEDRLKPDKAPFTSVGLDYFGPFLIKHGRSSEKRYGVIFTCLTSKAVHLEVAHSLDTSSFINALRRFIARRGSVQRIRSDNGTNFQGGEKELRLSLSEWNQDQIHNFLLQKNIDWEFNVPYASHHGGVWERQIRSVRKILSALCNEQRLTDESLSTLFCEVEYIINSRPLTTVSTDHRDLQPLTPNHLLQLKHASVFPPGVFEKKDLYCRKRLRQVQYLTDIFCKRWTKEYLPLLQKRQKWHHPTRNLAVDDIVLVCDNAPRNSWLLGRIIKVFVGKNQLVRSAEIQTKHGIIKRPITKLCLLSSPAT